MTRLEKIKSLDLDGMICLLFYGVIREGMGTAQVPRCDQGCGEMFQEPGCEKYCPSAVRETAIREWLEEEV